MATKQTNTKHRGKEDAEDTEDAEESAAVW